jgi:hypothetical protein
MRWSMFVETEPEMAAAGTQLFTQYGVGLGFLATVRADGGPRLHPMCPVLAEGGLYAFIVHAALPEGSTLFEFDVAHAMLSRYRHRGDWPPSYTIWHERS